MPGIAAVHVVTDDDRIAAAVRGFGGSALMTSEAARNGTERCAEALDQLDADVDIIVNFQGDALLTPPGFVTALVEQLGNSPDSMVATPAMRQRSDEVRKLQAEEAAGRVGGTSVVDRRQRPRALFLEEAHPLSARWHARRGRCRRSASTSASMPTAARRSRPTWRPR